jgi:ribosome-associated heat shock protein Hsp15
MSETVRLDKWLWAARFYKTRPLAQKAIEGGKVRVEGSRSKPGKQIQIGQQLEIRVGLELYEVTILALSEKRGPAPVARTLYEESPESTERRARESQARKAAAQAEPDFGGRPDKFQRRQIEKLLRKQRNG